MSKILALFVHGLGGGQASWGHFSHAVEHLVATRGRSWIERQDADRAIAILNRGVETFDKSSAEVIWSRYILIIARLFRDRDTSSTAIDDQLIANSSNVRLSPLLLAEKMELCRTRGALDEALALLRSVQLDLKQKTTPRSSGEAYAVGTSHFLIGNLLRSGGLYSNAQASIEIAQSYFRPGILAHQIELAHCYYALEVCQSVIGPTNYLRNVPASSAEFRPFAEALLMLARSHSEWMLAHVVESTELADLAAKSFELIGYRPYAMRAQRLSGLLTVWRRLELGAASEQAIGNGHTHSDLLRAMLGLPGSEGTLADKLKNLKASSVLGLLQFASSFNPDWTKDVGEFALPPLLKELESGYKWE